MTNRRTEIRSFHFIGWKRSDRYELGRHLARMLERLRHDGVILVGNTPEAFRALIARAFRNGARSPDANSHGKDPAHPLGSGHGGRDLLRWQTG